MPIFVIFDKLFTTMWRYKYLFAVIVLFCGNSCLPQDQATFNGDKTPVWTDISPGVRRFDCPRPQCPAHLTVFRFAKNAFLWKATSSDEARTVQKWSNDLPAAVFVVNGFYFDENNQPTGMLIAAGKKINNRKYDDDKVGFLELAPTGRVIDTSKEKIKETAIMNGGQSFPLIIKNGAAVDTFKDTRPSRRTFAGNDKEGNLYFGVVGDDTITFSDLAATLANTGVDWKNVLNLDGGTSTGFTARFGEYSELTNSIVQIPNVIYAEKK
jgi:uncharacterized protein YigE (DUF2233 family)